MNSRWIKILGIVLVLGLTGLLFISIFQKPELEIIVVPTSQLATGIPANESPTPESIHIFSGLIYKTSDDLFQVTDSGAAVNLAVCSADLLSADQKSMFYQQDGDIWQLDLKDCVSKNISHSLTSWEVNPQIWPSNLNKIFVGIDPEMSAGAPAIFDIDTAGLIYLDGPGGWTNSGVAPSPDGSQIAFRSNAGPAIYNVDLQVLEPLDLSEFNLDQNDFGRMEGPAWSPDGSKLAWVVGYQEQIGHLILDFTDNSYQILHLYTPVGRGGWPLPPVWSPDGNWLVVDVWAEDFSQIGLYILATNGSQEHFLGSQLINPIWSPDSQILIYTSLAETSTISFLSIEDWQANLLPIPDEGVPVAWPKP